MCTRLFDGSCYSEFCVGKDTRCQHADYVECKQLVRDGGTCRWSKTGRLDEDLPTDVCSPLCKMVLLSGVHWECDNPSCIACSHCVPLPPMPPPQPQLPARPPPPPSPPPPPPPSPLPPRSPPPPSTPPSPDLPNYDALLDQYFNVRKAYDLSPPLPYALWTSPPPPSPFPPPHPPHPPAPAVSFDRRHVLAATAVTMVLIACWWASRRSVEHSCAEDDEEAPDVDEEPEDEPVETQRHARRGQGRSGAKKKKAKRSRSQRYNSVATADRSDDYGEPRAPGRVKSSARANGQMNHWPPLD